MYQVSQRVWYGTVRYMYILIAWWVDDVKINTYQTEWRITEINGSRLN